MKACCALGAGKCNTWVWCPIDVCGKQTTHNGGGCWLGNRDVCTKSDQWKGGQRGIMPTPPPCQPMQVGGATHSRAQR